MPVVRAAVLLMTAAALPACRGYQGALPLPLQPGSAAGYSLVLVTIDTLRADRVGAYGHPGAKTPVLDRLAREGVRFETTITPAPLTLPAHATILTGLDPAGHGVHHNGLFRLDDSASTLAESLRAKGYDTAALVSTFVLDSRYGLDQGFETYDDRVEPAGGGSFGELESERDAAAVTGAAIEWLKGRKARDASFFLWVHYYDPHFPYHPPAPFESGTYDGEIAYVDSELGRLLEVLAESGNPTLLVVAGDHGESLGEHREKTHSRLIYDATQRVPFILWAPSLIRGPRVVEDLVGLVDLAPTLLELLGLEVPAGLDGRSLLRRAEGERHLYLETLAPYLDHGWAPLHGLRTRRGKYIEAPRPEYYDLQADPAESRNLFGADAPELHALRRALESKLEGIGPETVQSRMRPVDPEELRRLQSLGYLGGPGPASSTELPDPKDMMPVVELMEEAEEARRRGSIEEALEKLQRARARAPKDLQVLQALGVLYALSERYDEAEALFREYLNVRRNANVTILLANLLRETGRAGEGRALLEREAAVESEHGGLLVTLGDFLAAEGRHAEALRLYQRAKEVDPYRASSLANARILELRTGR